MSEAQNTPVRQIALSRPKASGQPKIPRKDRRANDEVSQFLLLTARLHTTHGSAIEWEQILQMFRDSFQCASVLDQLPNGATLGPDELAGRVSHCANFDDQCGNDDLVGGLSSNFKHQRCSALALHLHLHTAALSARKSLQAGLFDHLPPTSGCSTAADANMRPMPLRVN